MGKIYSVWVIGTVLAAALSGAAKANDSNANQSSGGLVLSKTDAVAMRSEELRISTERIHVRYEFQNVTDKDVTLTVAFPLPDVTPEYFNSSNGDIVGEQFETTIDGVAIPLLAERKAYLDGRDVTEKLAVLGLSPDPQVAIEKLTNMTKTGALEVIRKLVEQGLMEAYTVGGPEEAYNKEPQWIYRRKFYREQVFPAGKTVMVTHSYKPSVRRAINVPKSILDDANLRKRYCIDADLVRSLGSLAKRADQPYANTNEVNYILSTGANWAYGKIGDFRLVIDKGATGNMLSLCGSDIKKIGPTTFEMRKKDFTPTQELNILVIDAPL